MINFNLLDTFECEHSNLEINGTKISWLNPDAIVGFGADVCDRKIEEITVSIIYLVLNNGHRLTIVLKEDGTSNARFIEFKDYIMEEIDKS